MWRLAANAKSHAFIKNVCSTMSIITKLDRLNSTLYFSLNMYSKAQPNSFKTTKINTIVNNYSSFLPIILIKLTLDMTFLSCILELVGTIAVGPFLISRIKAILS